MSLSIITFVLVLRVFSQGPLNCEQYVTGTITPYQNHTYYFSTTSTAIWRYFDTCFDYTTIHLYMHFYRQSQPTILIEKKENNYAGDCPLNNLYTVFNFSQEFSPNENYILVIGTLGIATGYYKLEMYCSESFVAPTMSPTIITSIPTTTPTSIPLYCYGVRDPFYSGTYLFWNHIYNDNPYQYDYGDIPLGMYQLKKYCHRK